MTKRKADQKGINKLARETNLIVFKLEGEKRARLHKEKERKRFFNSLEKETLHRSFFKK